MFKLRKHAFGNPLPFRNGPSRSTAVSGWKARRFVTASGRVDIGQLPPFAARALGLEAPEKDGEKRNRLAPPLEHKGLSGLNDIVSVDIVQTAEIVQGKRIALSNAKKGFSLLNGVLSWTSGGPGRRLLGGSRRIGRITEGLHAASDPVDLLLHQRTIPFQAADGLVEVLHLFCDWIPLRTGCFQPIQSRFHAIQSLVNGGECLGLILFTAPEKQKDDGQENSSGNSSEEKRSQASGSRMILQIPVP